MRFPHWTVALLCAPLVLLAGCPQQQTTSNSVPAKAAAPALASAPASQPAPVMTKAQSDDLAAKTARTQALIRRSEDTYASGVSNYRAGRLEAARSDFDMAVDMMLTSGIDMKSDPQLSDDFDQLLNKINTLEMSALKEGTGFSAPIEAAPLDAADEVTFPPDAALTAKVKEELKTTQSDFPLVVNDYVAGFIRYFSSSPAGHAHLLRSLERAGKYKDMISKILRDQGVPQDLIYLAVMESGFQPQALNAKSGAGGMWQFMPTGAYGLARDGWVDERFDPEKSSQAYARYIKSLYDQFGDWYLAMAAYNWGPGYVQRSVMRTGYADFWELYRRNALPQETKNYVPGIIAAIIMAKNPKQYGLEGLVPDPAVVSDTVDVDYAIDLRLVADLADVSLPEIIALNPSLLRMTTPRDEDYDLHLPPGTRDVFLKRVQNIPEDKRTSWRFHVVRAGESLDTVASTFHDRAAEIASANHLGADAAVKAGDELVVPVNTASSAPRPIYYVTRLGDTLVTIADRFNVSVEDLRRWNHLSSSTIKPHHTLDVAQPVHLAPSTRGRSRRSYGASSAGGKQVASATKGATTKGATKSKSASASKTPSKSALSSRTSASAAHSAVATKKKRAKQSNSSK
jgi:membrane-bound lytic murein transglycosylase D